MSTSKISGGNSAEDRGGGNVPDEKTPALQIKKAALTDGTVKRLIELSELWVKEDCSYGMVKNERDDIKEPVYAAYDGGLIVGYAFGHFYTVEKKYTYIEPGQRCFCLDELYVLPEYRSRGVGRKLFEAISEYAETGAEMMTFSTSTKDYKRILKFYVEDLGCDFHDAYLIKRL